MSPVLARRRFLALFCALAALVFPAGTARAQDVKPVERIAFGSCNRPWHDQSLWRQVLANKPGVWVWLGDDVYANDNDVEDLRAKFAMARRNPEYAAVLRACTVLGTWDDHDFGMTDGGKNYAHKAESQRLLLDFLDVPADSPRRAQEGVYSSATFGPPGKRLKIILLDERYFRDEPGPDADMLGESQWRWLEAQLAGSDADVHLIGSGNQVLSSEHRYEKWADYPKSKARLFELLRKTAPRRVVLLSGDRHFGEISKMDDPALGPVFDITSSGMTHFAEPAWKNLWHDFASELNRFRVGKGYAGYNFGLVTIDWSQPRPVITLQVRDSANTARCEAVLR
jgi:alkaline phosphatase D